MYSNYNVFSTFLQAYQFKSIELLSIDDDVRDTVSNVTRLLALPACKLYYE
jgi:hypothetical protein